MPSKDDYRAEMELVNAHGVFSLDPNHFTTPIRMAAWAHCSNAREAMSVANDMEAAARLSGHSICRVGDFMEALAARSKREAERKAQ